MTIDEWIGEPGRRCADDNDTPEIVRVHLRALLEKWRDA